MSRNWDLSLLSRSSHTGWSIPIWSRTIAAAMHPIQRINRVAHKLGNAQLLLALLKAVAGRGLGSRRGCRLWQGEELPLSPRMRKRAPEGRCWCRVGVGPYMPQPGRLGHGAGGAGEERPPQQPRPRPPRPRPESSPVPPPSPAAPSPARRGQYSLRRCPCARS